MATSLAGSLGHKKAPIPVSWNKRDLLLYAVGVGAKSNDLSLVYERDANWAPLPTFAAVLMLKGNSGDVTHFESNMPSDSIPGLPQMDPRRLVHGSMSVEVLKDLPHTSGEGWQLSRRVTGINENKSGIVVMTELMLLDPKGTPYARLYSANFNLGAKATGEKFAKFIAGPPSQSKPVPKDRKPDYVYKDQTTPEQAVIYRLSGDYNPLHVDPANKTASSFGGPILHGLSTYGFAARALISTIAKGDAKSLKLFSAKFTAPVKPGEAIETHAWELGPGPNGSTEIAFVTINLSSGKVVLGEGLAYIKKGAKSKM